MNDYAVFILSYKRPDRVYTYETLRKCGYTGKIYIVCDDLDPTVEEYKKRFENVVVFSKEEARKITDTMDNWKAMNIVVYARQYMYKIAEDLGYKKFIVMDDDYDAFHYAFLKHGRKKEVPVKDMDKVFELFWKYMDRTLFAILAFAQGGDLIGGGTSILHKGFKRKAMNAFFCRTDRPVRFMGRINEDTNMYVWAGLRGILVGTIMHVRLKQKPTQKNAGGLTDAYLDLGTYIKSFYSVMVSPAAVKVSVLKQKNWRMHHKIDWRKVAVQIVPERVKRR